MRTILGASLLAGALLAGAPVATAASSAPGEPYLTYVGCDGFFGPSTAPRTRINIGPGAAPLGRRSLGMVPAGPGTAAGPAADFTSLVDADLTVMAHARTGTAGVSYVWALNASGPPGTAWHGTARVAVGAGQWQRLSAAETVYDWRLIDLATRTPVGAAGELTPAQLAAEHGDGPGYVVTGLGCDGAQFNIDAVRSGASVLDFEGLTLSTTIDVDSPRVVAGKTVTVTGAVRDGSGRITGDPLVLEQRRPGGAWQPVGDPVAPAPSGWATATVVIEAETELRWHRPESQYADEGWSEAARVELATQ